MEKNLYPFLMKDNLRKRSPLPRDHIFILTRTHWLIPAQTIAVAVFLFTTLFFSSFLGFLSFSPSPALFIISSLLLCMFALMFTVKVLADWYFHFYVITDRKIAEVCYLPLSTHYVNEVMLDRVKCTEVDVRTEGLLHQLLNIGSVTVTFDRPTHEDAFMFWYIGNAQEIGSRLTGQFVHLQPQETQAQDTTVFHRLTDNARRYYTTEEIMPGLQI